MPGQYCCSSGESLSTLSQNLRSRGSLSAGRLPVMIAPFTAPIEVPITQSGSVPASCIASYTPA